MPGEKELSKKPVKTQADAKQFFDYLIEVEKANFHPDDNFEDYVNSSSQKKSFTPEKAKELNARMSEAVKLLGKDVYALAQQASDAHYSELKANGGNLNIKPKLMFQKGGEMGDMVLLPNPTYQYQHIIKRWLEGNTPEHLQYKVAVSLLNGEKNNEEKFGIDYEKYCRILRALEKSGGESRHEMAWRTENYSLNDAEEWTIDALKRYFILKTVPPKGSEIRTTNPLLIPGAETLTDAETLLLKKLIADEGLVIEKITKDPGAKEYDIKLEGTRPYKYGASRLRFGSWLPLHIIRNYLPWDEPAIAQMTDYPDMARSGDWSGVRDTRVPQIWKIFDTCFLMQKKESGGGVRARMCPIGTEIQTLVFDKEKFSAPNAKAWANEHGFGSDYIDETENNYRIRQQSPDIFRKDSFRTIPLRSGVKAVIACPIE